MEQELISKKELLEMTGISYGQLYRWKRKNLIPEDWFIRKSTFTGQETFFPKDRILARVEKIKNMKEDLSLDDLADVFSPDLVQTVLSGMELIERNIVSKMSLEFYIQQKGATDTLPFEKILFLYVLEKLFQAGTISLDEGKMVLELLEEDYPKLAGKQCELLFLRKMGMATCFLTAGNNEVYYESGIRVITRLSLGGCIEELKTKL